MKSRRSKGGQYAAAFFALACLAWAAWSALDLVPDAVARLDAEPSVRMTDREGRLLREFLSPQETRGRWTGLDELSPHLVNAALAAEDHRFRLHPGVDPLAVLRAAWQNIRAGSIVSGASTISMQVCRLADPGARSFFFKIRQAVQALALEKRHGKDHILAAYLNHVPCGNLIRGAPAAARHYLGKNPDRLTPAEAAFIMALPQAPGRMNPYRAEGRAAALRRRNVIIGRMAGLGMLTPAQADRARSEGLALSGRDMVFEAPHFTTWLRARLPRDCPAEVVASIDLPLQRAVERMTAESVGQAAGRGVGQAAVVVMDHAAGEILAWVGSADFFDPRGGQNDGVTALRQPGSAVKPFTYAAAFDRGYAPASTIEDRPVEYGQERGVYRPVNYDRRYHGRVTLRTALASSLNVPAVRLLDLLGVPQVLRIMRRSGLASLDKEPDYYGLGLTLGCGEVSLLELAAAYAALASGGVYRPPSPLAHPRAERMPERRVFSRQAAWLTTDILSDDAARATGFGRDSLLNLPFPAAAKTGTSKNFRDNWCVGYTSRVVVAVWAGNFDARPMGRVSGISGAGPLWRQVMRLCADRYPPEDFEMPDGVDAVEICAESGLAAAPGCPNRRLEYFASSADNPGRCLRHFRPRTLRPAPDPRPARSRPAIVSPRSGERYMYDPGIETGFQNLALQAAGAAGLDEVVWLVNGRVVGRVRPSGSEVPTVYWPLQPGRAVVKMVGLREGRETVREQACIIIH